MINVKIEMRTARFSFFFLRPSAFASAEVIPAFASTSSELIRRAVSSNCFPLEAKAGVQVTHSSSSSGTSGALSSVAGILKALERQGLGKVKSERKQ